MSNAVRLWRISDYDNLSGDGGLKASARWHSRGNKIVYLADHPASALLEMMVHLEVNAKDIPTGFQLLTVDIPDDASIEKVDDEQLPPDWRNQSALTRKIGDDWLRARLTMLLRVPSALAPATFHYLLNPSHPSSGQIRIAQVTQALFDKRLLDFITARLKEDP